MLSWTDSTYHILNYFNWKIHCYQEISKCFFCFSFVDYTLITFRIFWITFFVLIILILILFYILFYYKYMQLYMVYLLYCLDRASEPLSSLPRVRGTYFSQWSQLISTSFILMPTFLSSMNVWPKTPVG